MARAVGTCLLPVCRKQTLYNLNNAEAIHLLYAKIAELEKENRDLQIKIEGLEKGIQKGMGAVSYTHLEKESRYIGNVVMIFTVLMLSVFPLYYRNYYSDILNVKYQFCYVAIITMVVLIACLLYTSRLISALLTKHFHR